MRLRILVMLAALGCSTAAPRAVDGPVYDVYAIRYATLEQFPVSGLVAGADKDRKLDIAMMVWLIRGNGRNVLVDSGFYRSDLVDKWKPADYIRPDKAVARAGVKPEDVTDVIVTHAHWDHADGADLFPNAHLWIQKDEFVYYESRAGQSGVTVEDMNFFASANQQGRLSLVDGDQEILPGIRVYTGGRHTYASQYVSATTRSGPVVLASDNVYLYENLDKHVPIAQTFDSASNLAAQDRMKTVVRDPQLIVPGHDPAVMTRFPKDVEGVVRITPR